MQIVPGILVNDVEILEEQLMSAVGLVPWIQVDFLDGEYADNLTVRPSEVDLSRFRRMIENVRKAKVMTSSYSAPKGKHTKFEAHLMVSMNNFDSWLQEAIEAGFDRIITQVESVGDQDKYIRRLRIAGIETGLSIDANTQVNALNEKILNDLDLVLVMTIRAGFQGQKFMPEMLEKVKELNELRIKNNELRFVIEIDGGMNLETISIPFKAEIDYVISGSSLFGGGDFQANLSKLEERMV